jgi:glutathione S-transferase
MIKLYYHPASTFARRVRIALLEKDIPHELHQLDMTGREHRGAAYLALNPYGRVPALVEDDFVLYESNSILNYLEWTHPRPALVPTDIRARALVDMHMRLADMQFGRYAGAILFPKRFLPAERWDVAAMAAARTEIEKHVAVLEQTLKGRQYLVAEQFTLADVSYIPFVHFFPLMEITPPPAVEAWTARLLARPSAEATAPAF